MGDHFIPDSYAPDDLAGLTCAAPASASGAWASRAHANLRQLRALGVEPVLVDDRRRPATPDGLRCSPPPSGGLDALAALRRGGQDARASAATGPRWPSWSERGIPVAGGLGLWLQEADRDRVVCVTGTKGKSRPPPSPGTCSPGSGYRCLVGGNIGRRRGTRGVDGAAYDYWVIETSSYQATDLPCSPPVVAVTSLHPDHLDWHGGVETYYRDKLSVCTQPGADLTIANGDSDLLRERAALLGPRVSWVARGRRPGRRLDGAARPARHAQPAQRADRPRRACARSGVPQADDDAALRARRRGLRAPAASRLQPSARSDGVTFVDDSLSTNVLPTLAAMDAFPGRRVALIVGGHDRGIDYAPLAAGLAAGGPAPRWC